MASNLVPTGNDELSCLDDSNNDNINQMELPHKLPDDVSNNELNPQNIKKDINSSKILPDPNLLESMRNLGLDKHLSRKALICTKNKSLEEAVDWIAGLGAEEMEALSFNSDASSDCSNDWEDCEDEVGYKMVFVVNSEHGMGSGKIASQVMANSISLPNYMVIDAGKTEVPDGSVTVLSIFGDEETVDKVTGHLKLL
ncbi:Peptidyl-tRNA hydrolase [Armadillidium nasatum]|uniref:peptidyl-tRNA hydrolase n=1 Tax=Armadillidium nasatum TaxID=96803 RepID=A0A5N5TJD5_9CRUS|nr:Peptidyl-tRNA hydrolase [Armadillidium nasatum]